MKGYTKIELYNLQTGQTEEHEDHNMVTNALAAFLQAAGMLDNHGCLSSDKVRVQPLWKMLLGGILLFDREIEENVDNLLPPEDIYMTGNGSYNYTHTGAVTELGNWNANESGIQEDGSLRLVWDFSTDQANGTIHCLCLTSAPGGFYGYGNHTSDTKYDATTVNNVTYESMFTGIEYSGQTMNHPMSNGYLYILYADMDHNSIFYVDKDSITYDSGNPSKHWSNTGEILINQYHIGISKIDIRETKIVDMLMDTYHITVPDEIKQWITNKQTCKFTILVDENCTPYILFVNNTAGTITKNEQCKILKIKDDYTTEVYTITNTSDIRLQPCFENSKFNNIYKGNLYTKGDGEYTYLMKINLSDSTDITQIGTADSNIHTTLIVGDNLFWATNGGYGRIVQNSLEKMNGRKAWGTKIIPIKGNPLLYLFSNTTQNTFGFYRCNQYLATINNLDEPVIKTASKTMKVTYTITFD